MRIVHRLDAVTSGLVVIAKNKEMARECTNAFEQSRVKKPIGRGFKEVLMNKENTLSTLLSVERKDLYLNVGMV